MTIGWKHANKTAIVQNGISLSVNAIKAIIDIDEIWKKRVPITLKTIPKVGEVLC